MFKAGRNRLRCMAGMLSPAIICMAGETVPRKTKGTEYEPYLGFSVDRQTANNTHTY